MPKTIIREPNVSEAQRQAWERITELDQLAGTSRDYHDLDDAQHDEATHATV